MVVEYGGFSAAERATDIPKSKLSRRIQKLEEYLDIRLIHRNSRQFWGTARLIIPTCLLVVADTIPRQPVAI